MWNISQGCTTGTPAPTPGPPSVTCAERVFLESPPMACPAKVRSTQHVFSPVTILQTCHHWFHCSFKLSLPHIGLAWEIFLLRKKIAWSFKGNINQNIAFHPQETRNYCLKKKKSLDLVSSFWYSLFWLIMESKTFCEDSIYSLAEFLIVNYIGLF